MPTLETHTLNQGAAEEQLAAIVAGAGTISAATEISIKKAPATSGAFSIQAIEDQFFLSESALVYTNPHEEDVIYSSLGDELGTVQEESERKDRFAQFPVALGILAARASVSATTGCWSITEQEDPEVWRNDKGYSFTWNPQDYGYKISRPEGFRGVQIHRMAYNMKRRLQGLPDLNRFEQVDHVCRWPGCCNIDHLRVMNHRENNQQRDLARDLEAALIAGQTIIGYKDMGGVRIAWLDEHLQTSTSEFTNIIITTANGPHRIILIDKDPVVFRAEPEPCDLLEAVKQPALPKYERPTRSKSVEVFDMQDILFEQAVYAAKKAKTRKLYEDSRSSPDKRLL